MVSTFLQSRVISFPASCIQRYGFQIETQHQGAKPPPLVQCLYFPASPLLNDLHHSGFVAACSDFSLAVWNR